MRNYSVPELIRKQKPKGDDGKEHIPLLSGIYEGASTDKVSVKDLIKQVELKNMELS